MKIFFNVKNLSSSVPSADGICKERKIHFDRMGQLSVKSYDYPFVCIFSMGLYLFSVNEQ